MAPWRRLWFHLEDRPAFEQSFCPVYSVDDPKEGIFQALGSSYDCLDDSEKVFFQAFLALFFGHRDLFDREPAP